MNNMTIDVTLINSGNDLKIAFTTIFKLSLDLINLRGLNALKDLNPFAKLLYVPKFASKIHVKIVKITIEKSRMLKGSFKYEFSPFINPFDIILRINSKRNIAEVIFIINAISFY